MLKLTIKRMLCLNVMTSHRLYCSRKSIVPIVHSHLAFTLIFTQQLAPSQNTENNIRRSASKKCYDPLIHQFARSIIDIALLKALID